jgi:hypothetical protein
VLVWLLDFRNVSKCRIEKKSVVLPTLIKLYKRTSFILSTDRAKYISTIEFSPLRLFCLFEFNCKYCSFTSIKLNIAAKLIY